MTNFNQGPRCNSKRCSGESVGQNGASLSGISANHASFGPSVKQVPPDEIGGKILYAGSDGKIYNKHGQLLKHDFSPAKRHRNNRVSGKVYPYLVHYHAYYHRLIGRTFLRKLRKGEVYDHIDGDITNYSVRNLRIIKTETNYRDGGFLRKLRNKGIDPRMYDQSILLRFYSRMAAFKATHSKWQYDQLARTDLLAMLVSPDFRVTAPHAQMEYEMTHHMEC